MAVGAEKRLSEIIPNFRRVQGTKLYRSSKLDKLGNSSNIKLLGRVGIKTILDLRSSREVPQSCIIDSYYQRAAENAKAERTADREKDSQTSKSQNQTVKNNYLGTHHTTDMFGHPYAKEVMSRLPVFSRILVWLLFVIDRLLGTTLGYKRLVSTVLNNEGCTQQYIDILNCSGNKIAKALDLLSEEANVPGLVCCSWGKDRTGLLCALVQALCGLDRTLIAADYALSQEVLERTGVYKEMVSSMTHYNIHPRYAECKEEFMEEVLDFIQTAYGSVEAYLEVFGLSREKQKMIINNLKI